MRATKKILSSVLAVCVMASASIIPGMAAVADGEPASATNAYAKANEAIDAAYTYDGDDLGADYTPREQYLRFGRPRQQR